MAKLCKVKVNEFSIGFGPEILNKKGTETIYKLRLIPLGGFVSMEGEDKKSDEKSSFSKATMPRKMAIVLAGATVNIIFGMIIYFMLLMASGHTYMTNEILDLQDGFVAKEIGMQPGDKILEINNEKIKDSKDIKNILNKNDGKEVEVKFSRAEEEVKTRLQPTIINSKSAGIYLDKKFKVVKIEKGSMAEKSGIRINDKITKIDGEPIKNVKDEFAKKISEKDEILFQVVRDNEKIDISVKLDIIPNYYLGVIFKEADDNFINRIKGSSRGTLDFIKTIIDNTKQLFTGKVSINQMMGPVGISEAVASTNGITEFIEMMALISISLGVTNLLPIPALDGGKMCILILESIRGKTLKEETEMKIQLIGFALLITLSIFITYNDILRIR